MKKIIAILNNIYDSILIPLKERKFKGSIKSAKINAEFTMSELMIKLEQELTKIGSIKNETIIQNCINILAERDNECLKLKYLNELSDILDKDVSNIK